MEEQEAKKQIRRKEGLSRRCQLFSVYEHREVLYFLSACFVFEMTWIISLLTGKPGQANDQLTKHTSSLGTLPDPQ